jgi:hypothetical protein
LGGKIHNNCLRGLRIHDMDEDEDAKFDIHQQCCVKMAFVALCQDALVLGYERVCGGGEAFRREESRESW